MLLGDAVLKLDVCMDFEPYFKVHNLVSVHPKSVILGQMINLDMIFYVVVSVDRLVQIWNSPQFPLRNGLIQVLLKQNSWDTVLKKKFCLVGTSGVCYERVKLWVRDVICMSHQSYWINSSQPIKFLVFVSTKCNKILLFVSCKCDLTLLFFTYSWLQLILTNQWLVFTRSE